MYPSIIEDVKSKHNLWASEACEFANYLQFLDGAKGVSSVEFGRRATTHLAAECRLAFDGFWREKHRSGPVRNTSVESDSEREG